METLHNKIQNSKVLIVDDMPENLQVLGNTLNAQGFRVAFATSGSQALSIAQSKSPDLILLDIQMPEMDGYETCQNLMNNPETKDIPVIFLTARNEIDDIVKGFEIGAVDYITKPFNQKELIARVTNHLELKHSRDLINNQNSELLESQSKIASDAQRILHLNDELITNQIKLQESNAAKDKFFSIIAHDLKSPFSGLFGLSQLLVEQYQNLTEDDLKMMFENLYISSRKLYNLLENLLEWSRNQMGKTEYQPFNDSIGLLTNKTLSYFVETAKAKQITINNYINENVNALVDRNMFSTIIRNLISNAIKFTPNSGKIKLYTNDYDENYLQVTIEDTGVGIQEKNIEKLFKLDVKYSTSGTNDEHGTGLGLLLCKDFIEKHNGKIWVESEVGVGTKFHFTVPKGKDI